MCPLKFIRYVDMAIDSVVDLLTEGKNIEAAFHLGRVSKKCEELANEYFEEDDEEDEDE